MSQLAKLLNDARQAKIGQLPSYKTIFTSENMQKLALSLLKVQRILIKVFMCTAGRLSDNLCQLMGHFYSLIGPELLSDSVSRKLFEELVKNDLKLMRAQNQCSFNPALLLVKQMLGAKNSKVTKDLADYIADTKQTMYPQLMTNMEADGLPRLEYLQL